jgi:hypothetical protein
MRLLKWIQENVLHLEPRPVKPDIPPEAVERAEKLSKRVDNIVRSTEYRGAQNEINALRRAREAHNRGVLGDRND